MRCPKCNHEQHNTVECSGCGLIFEKYQRFQQHQKEKKEKEAQKKSRYTQFLGTGFLLVAAVATTYYFTKPSGQDGPENTVTISDREETSIKRSEEQGKPVYTVMSTEEIQVLTPIERARQATVSIETPWGTGSGFFIDKNYIVTNRHVVEFKKEDLLEIQRKVETSRKLVDLEEEKIGDLRRRLEQMANGPGKNQLAIIIEDRQATLAGILDRQRESEARLAQLEKDMATPDIKVVLFDGTTHNAGYIVLSQNHDLALVALFAHDAVSLRTAPPNTRFNQGDRVFTVGSPVGLRHTVTAGVFSGYRKRGSDNQIFLQTDAAINPGNSGGPLIDENGYVHGVNTMIMENAEGIGFAIPITTVFEEFGSSLPGL